MSDDPSDIDLDRPVAEKPGAIERPSRRPLWTLAAVAALALALIVGFRYLSAPPHQTAPAARAPLARPATAQGPEPGDQVLLPPLDQTDALVRQLVGQLSSHPTVAAWLTTDGLILNFALVTRRISDGESPVQELRPLGPVPAFHPRNLQGALFIDPSSYRRYDRYAEAVSALDARGTARLYATLKPRILEAYRRMGPPTADFDPVLEGAIVELLKVPVVQGDVELAPSGIVYSFVDPKLEELSAAQKNLLRMGPQNIQAVQKKLREIAQYLGIPATRLPR